MTSEVDSVLLELDLNGPYSQAEYVRTMDMKFGRAGSKYLDAMDCGLAGDFDSTNWEQLYQLKNRD